MGRKSRDTVPSSKEFEGDCSVCTCCTEVEYFKWVYRYHIWIHGLFLTVNSVYT